MATFTTLFLIINLGKTGKVLGTRLMGLSRDNPRLMEFKLARIQVPR